MGGARSPQTQGACCTVGLHNFNLRIFNLRVSNPNKLIVDVFLTRCRIPMCQGLGPKNTMKFRKSTVAILSKTATASKQLAGVFRTEIMLFTGLTRSGSPKIQAAPQGNSTREEPKREPKRSPKGAQEEPKRSPRGAQEEPKRSPRGAQRILVCEMLVQQMAAQLSFEVFPYRLPQGSPTVFSYHLPALTI